MAGGLLGSYQQVSVDTADPAALVVQLFDGALRFLGRARRAAASGDHAQFAFAVSRAHAIVTELSNTLDREAGAEAAESLDALYYFAQRKLGDALLQRSVAEIDEVIAVLEPLREAFDGARGR